MGGSDYDVTDSRIGDSASPIGWEAVCDADVTGWVKTNNIVVALFIQSGAHTPDSEAFKVQYEKTTDDPGTWIDVGAAGECKFGTSDELNDTDPVGDTAGCQTTTDSEELEGDGQTKSFGLAQNAYAEIQIAISLVDALDGKQYTFRLWSTSANAALTAAAAQITTEAGVTQETVTFTVDAHLVDRLSLTGTSADAHLVDRLSLTGTTADAHLIDRLSLTGTTADAHLVDRLSLTGTSADAHLISRVSLYTTGDAHLVSRITLTGTTVDAHLTQEAFTVTTSADAHLVDRLTLTSTTDAHLVDRLSVYATGDAHLVDRLGITTSADAHLTDRLSIFTTSDAHLVDRISITTTADAILAGTVQLTVDAHLKALGLTVYLTVDAVIKAARGMINITLLGVRERMTTARGLRERTISGWGAERGVSASGARERSITKRN